MHSPHMNVVQSLSPVKLHDQTRERRSTSYSCALIITLTTQNTFNAAFTTPRAILEMATRELMMLALGPDDFDPPFWEVTKVEYRQLGRCGLRVSVPILGTMVRFSTIL